MMTRKPSRMSEMTLGLLGLPAADSAPAGGSRSGPSGCRMNTAPIEAKKKDTASRTNGSHGATVNSSAASGEPASCAAIA